MAYSAASDVAMLCRNLVGAASNFDTSTSPTAAQINVWLSSGCSLINAALASHGYSAIPITSGAYDLASQTNALYGAWLAERSLINARVTSDERTRADMFKRDFEYHLDLLLGLDLATLGVTLTTTGGGAVYAGGISHADKSAVESDTDRVLPRFIRGQFTNPEAPRAVSTDTDDQARD